MTMADDGTAFAAIAETTSFLNYFNDLPDYLQAGKVDYPLPEVLLLILLAVLAGAEAFTDIARFGEKKLELLRRFCRSRTARLRNRKLVKHPPPDPRGCPETARRLGKILSLWASGEGVATFGVDSNRWSAPCHNRMI
jgi:hypothetical protein